MSVQDEINQLSSDDPNFLEKLNALAVKHAQSQGQKVQAAVRDIINPSDLFICDGCE